jgi:hypothetical protein
MLLAFFVTVVVYVVLLKKWSVYIQKCEWHGSRIIVSLAVAMSLKDTLPPSFCNSLRLYY